MNNAVTFNDVLDAVDHLSLDEQESLIDVIRRRIADHRRQEISLGNIHIATAIFKIIAKDYFTSRHFFLLLNAETC
ncbi:hypothetical protein KKHLCK_04015 [Candidatus Electrothrix laxa]